jgi:hypothetical protein
VDGEGMNANQVVIVMDRAEAEETTNALGFAQGNGYDNPANGSAQMVMAAALGRDPDELEARLAKAIGEAIWKHDNSEKRDFKAFLARAALAVVTGKEGVSE